MSQSKIGALSATRWPHGLDAFFIDEHYVARHKLTSLYTRDVFKLLM